MAESTESGPRVFLASRNAKKIEEMRRILDVQLPGIAVLGLDDVAPYDEPVEDQPSFEGNALLKARAGLAATGLPSLADDSGLCVDALNEMPGVLSARWSGLPKSDERNNALLLDQLHDVPDERRSAEFRCVVARLPSRRLRARCSPARCAGGCCVSCAAAAASATTRCSFPRTRTATSPRPR